MTRVGPLSLNLGLAQQSKFLFLIEGGLRAAFLFASRTEAFYCFSDWRNPVSALSLRLPESLHKQAKQLSKDEGMSITQFITSAVAEKLAALMTETYLAERAVRGNREAFESVLAKVPDTEPDEHDGLELT